MTLGEERLFSTLALESGKHFFILRGNRQNHTFFSFLSLAGLASSFPAEAAMTAQMSLRLRLPREKIQSPIIRDPVLASREPCCNFLWFDLLVLTCKQTKINYDISCLSLAKVP